MRKRIKALFALILFVGFVVLNVALLEVPIQAGDWGAMCRDAGCKLGGSHMCAMIEGETYVLYCWGPWEI